MEGPNGTGPKSLSTEYTSFHSKEGKLSTVLLTCYAYEPQHKAASQVTGKGVTAALTIGVSNSSPFELNQLSGGKSGLVLEIQLTIRC